MTAGLLEMVSRQLPGLDVQILGYWSSSFVIHSVLIAFENAAGDDTWKETRICKSFSSFSSYTKTQLFTI